MDKATALGFGAKSDEREIIEFLNMKLAARGLPIYGKPEEFRFYDISRSILSNLREKNRILSEFLPPVDQRIQSFLNDYLGECFEGKVPSLPANSLTLERHGMARTLSLPPDRDSFTSDIVRSNRVKQGVVHNPKYDRRTTKGSFHIAEGGLPIPADKIAVPKAVFSKLYKESLNPPKDLMCLPFTSTQEEQASCFVSLLLRPPVVPEVEGWIDRKTMEVRFFAPGNLVSNLDFVESIFGNAGDPYLPDNNAALDAGGWTGTTGCVILAPHLIYLKKKDLGIPHISEATDRQKRDGICWENEDEPYNGGNAFKVTCRDERGIMVTLIADNYFGYSKKEVKTQISFSANLFGMAEEEHAGGAIAYASYDLGEDFAFSSLSLDSKLTYTDTLKNLEGLIDPQPQGFARDSVYDDIVYVREDVRFNLHDQRITWMDDEGQEQSIRLRPGNTYFLPSGYKVEMFQPAEGRRWRLIGTVAEGTYCHKPCTVSGGGKSEISKSIADAILHGPVFTVDFNRDFDFVEYIIKRSYEDRYKDENKRKGDKSRAILSPERSIGSVIKLLTPSNDYTDEYNTWLKSIPFYIKDLVLLVKRYYKPDWGDNWRSRFSVDSVNGKSGNRLKYRDNYILSHYLRVGYSPDGGWRTFSFRKDFYPAAEVQTEDDISATVVVPTEAVNYLGRLESGMPSIKFVTNCEYRFFQRPDEAIHRGYDKTTEQDFSGNGLFFSNYEPLNREQIAEMADDAIRFSQYTLPMQKTLREFLEDEKPEFVISSAHPRLVNGVPSKNPRYLQSRQDMVNPRIGYIAEMGTRLHRSVPRDHSVPVPVHAVLPGRRNNPPDKETGIRALCVYNPLHYQELPELFMDYIASLTGKSPSTTGAGSEGALTKGPFNALPPIVDLNNALVSYLATNLSGFSSAAGYVGPYGRVDHDISLLVPELWSRMRPEERDPNWLIEHGYLDTCQDFEYEGEDVLASRLGSRINEKFTRVFLGRVFSNPDSIFPPEWLKPELQDMEIFVDGLRNIVETQRRVALLYFEDNSIEMACPPLKALLHIMAYNEYEGKSINDPEIRDLFTRESMLKSDWYAERLKARCLQERRHWQMAVAELEAFMAKPRYADEVQRLAVADSLKVAQEHLKKCQQPEYQKSLIGSLGTDPAFYKHEE